MKRPICHRTLCAPFVAALSMIVVMAGAAVPAYASERGHGAHVHGVGQLNLAIEGDEVEIEITAPGADIVGFEHRPETDEDRKALADAVAKLKDGGALFQFPATAACKLEEAEVHSGLMEGDDGHGKEHGHGHVNKHGHEQQEEHAEFRAHYHFHCAQPAKVTYVDLEYFKVFPAAKELEAKTLTSRGQGAQELTAERPRLTF